MSANFRNQNNMPMAAHLLDQKFACPIAVIILTIFKSLTGICQPTDSQANGIPLVKPAQAGTFFRRRCLSPRTHAFCGESLAWEVDSPCAQRISQHSTNFNGRTSFSTSPTTYQTKRSARDFIVGRKISCQYVRTSGRSWPSK